MDIMKRGVRMRTQQNTADHFDHKTVKSAFYQASKKAGAVLAILAVGLSMLTGCKKVAVPEKQDYKVVSQEQEGDQVHVVVSDEKAYAQDMPIWDGRSLTFSDGTVVSPEEYGGIVIRDSNGNEVDRYTDVDRENKVDLIDYGIVEIREDGTQPVVYYVVKNEEEFKENRPMWDGRNLTFGRNDTFVESIGTAVKAYIVEDQNGNELAIYIPDYSMPEDEYKLSRIIKSIEKNGDTTIVNLNVIVEDDDVECIYDPVDSNYIFGVYVPGGIYYEEEMSTRYLRVLDYKGNFICEYDKCPDNYSDSLPSFVISQDYDGVYINYIVKKGTCMEELHDYAYRKDVLVFKDGTSIPIEMGNWMRFTDEAGNEIFKRHHGGADNRDPYVWDTRQDDTNIFIYLCDDFENNSFTLEGNVMTFIDGTKVYLKAENVRIYDRELQLVDEFTVDLPDNMGQ